jgi:hypothetical protein
VLFLYLIVDERYSVHRLVTLLTIDSSEIVVYSIRRLVDCLVGLTRFVNNYANGNQSRGFVIHVYIKFRYNFVMIPLDRK